MSKRRSLVSVLLAVGVGLTVPAVAEAAPVPQELTLTSYTATVVGPNAPAEVCDYSQINCGYLAVQATFSGLDRFARPTDPIGPPEGGFSGSAQVRREYGCADAGGKRLHRYDRSVTEVVGLNTRRGSGFKIPRTGDTLTSTTYAFLADLQPGNCPAGTTATTYKIVATKIQLALDFYVEGFPDATYKAPARAQWVGAVPAPLVA